MSTASFAIAVSGMRAQQSNMTVIANNIANSKTTGYKSNSMTFEEMLVPNSGQHVNGLSNQYGSGVRVAGQTSDWTTGALNSTNNAAHIAVSGDGFLPVLYNGEIYYTRAGDFALVATDPANPDTTDYILQRPNGAVLLGGVAQDPNTGTVTGGLAPVTFKGITVVDPITGVATTYPAAPSSFEIASNGAVTPRPADQVFVENGFVGVQRFTNPDSLKRLDAGMYMPSNMTAYSTGNGGAETPSIPGDNGSGYLLQGSLEDSNVDLVMEFTNMIEMQRAFQANSKTITTTDEMLQTVIGIIR